MDDTVKKLPEKFLAKLPLIVSDEKKREEILNSFTKRRPTTFRVNTLKKSAQQVEKTLEKLGFVIAQADWYEDAFVLLSPSKDELMDTDLYKNGEIYVQSLSSMIPALVLDPQENEKILDLTAAPGSKTTQIAMMMKNTGQIMANDTSRPRLYRLEANCKMQGVNNTKVTQFPGQMVWQRFPEHFDRTLVDAPCSMEGRFYTEDVKTFRDWTTNKVKELARRQCFLLRSAISATKVGGVVVYSTCTISPEENEEVLEWILEREGDAIELEKVTIKGLEFDEGLSNFKDKKYNSEVRKSLRIFPSDTMEGFFVAKIRKNKSTLPPPRKFF